MAKPKEVSVSLIRLNGEVFIWNASFKLAVDPPQNEAERIALQKKIEAALKNLDL